MPASNSAAVPQTPESGPEHVVRFTFPVTWSFLSQDASVPKIECQEPPSSLDVATAPTEFHATAETTELAAPVPAIDRLSGDADRTGASFGVDRWEMVIPKMSRPAARSSPKLIRDSPTAMPDENTRNPAENDSKTDISSNIGPPNAAPIEGNTAEIGAPEFAFLNSKLQGSTRKFLVAGVAAVAAVFLAGVFAFSPKQESVRPKRPAPVALMTGPAIPAGAGQWTPLAEFPRRISVVRGSTKLTDFRMEFQIPYTAKPVGWIFRTRDSRNYYAMRWEPGKSSTFFERFAVIDGRDQPAEKIPVTIESKPGAITKIRTEAFGSTFTTWINDRKVDEWTDANLREGGVGLFNQSAESSATVTGLAVFPLVKK